MAKTPTATDFRTADIAKELTIAWIEKYGNNSSFYPDAEQVSETFKAIYSSLKETL